MDNSATTSATAVPLLKEHIAVTPGVCGGKSHIVGHRIKVQHIAVWHERMGLSPDEIVSQHPGLHLADVYAGLTYYHDHREEIDADIREGEEFADRLRAGAPSIFEKARQQHAKDDPLSSG